MTTPYEFLLKVQEHETILDETKLIHGEEHTDDMEELENELAELRNSVPEKMLIRYDRLREKGVLGVTKLIDGRCKACHMSIAVGDISRMKNNTMSPECPNCQVYLVLDNEEKK